MKNIVHISGQWNFFERHLVGNDIYLDMRLLQYDVCTTESAPMRPADDARHDTKVQ